jgi:Ca2+/Na+ antiporter
VEHQASINIVKVQKILTYVIAFVAYLSSTTLLDPFSSGIFLLLFIFAIYGEKYAVHLPKYMIYLAAILAIALSLLLLDNILVQTFIILILVKLLKYKEHIKEYHETFLISIVLFLIASFFINKTIFTFYFTILIFVSTFYLVLYGFSGTNDELEVSKKEFMHIAWTSLGFIVAGIILASLIYHIIPRLDKSKFHRYKKAKLGFSKIVNLGDTSEIQKRNFIALRVKMPKIDQKALYFRGYTAQYFNGRRWLNLQEARTKETKLIGEQVVEQQFFVKPFSPIYIFGLDIPQSSDYENLAMNSSFSMMSSRFIDSSFSYKVESLMNAQIKEQLLNQEDFLQIPRRLSKETKEEIQKIVHHDTSDIFKSVEDYFKRYYQYSLTGLPESETPLKDFINIKRGNCEYFASLASLALRSSGYPTRLVVGFRGGSYNEADGFYTVYQRDAHAWLEVYTQNSWIRFDPTPPLYTVMKTPLEQSLQPLNNSIKSAYEYISFYTHKIVIYLVKLKKDILDIFVEEIDFGTYEAQNKAAFKFIKELFLYVVSVVFYLYLIDCRYSPFIKIKELKLYRFFFKSNEEKIINQLLKVLKQQGYRKAPNESLKQVAKRIQEEKFRKFILAFLTEFECYYYKDKVKFDKIYEKLNKDLKEYET